MATVGSCPSCYQNSSPEAPSITINTTTVTMNGANLKWYNEYYNKLQDVYDPATDSGYDSASNTITLLHYPVDAEAIQLSVNGVVQGEGTAGTDPAETWNFEVHGKILVLKFTPDDDDMIQVHYMGYEAATGVASIVVGTQIDYFGTVAPPGWLRMDGSTSHSIATYPALFAFAYASDAAGVVPKILKSSDLVAGTFVLRDQEVAYWDGVAGGPLYHTYRIIKT